MPEDGAENGPAAEDPRALEAALARWAEVPLAGRPPVAPLDVAMAFVAHAFFRSAPATDRERRHFWAVVSRAVGDPRSGEATARLAAEAERALGREGERCAASLMAMVNRREAQRRRRAEDWLDWDRTVFAPAQTIFLGVAVLSGAALNVTGAADPAAMAALSMVGVLISVAPLVFLGLGATTVLRVAVTRMARANATSSDNIKEFLRIWRTERELLQGRAQAP
jgi:hypothetical protein